MRIRLVLALCLMGAGLGGCTMTSTQPLFAMDQAPKHPMKEGLWAMTGPGCEVKPLPAGQPLPECVGETMTLAGDRMTWELIASPIGPVPPEQLKQITGTLPAGGRFVLVDGDPNIVEMIQDPPKTAITPPRPTLVGYMSLRSLEQDSAGRIVRGVLWVTPCPDKTGQPGFNDPSTPKPVSLCRAETQDAVRTQAPHMKPFVSFFVTWVR